MPDEVERLFRKLEWIAPSSPNCERFAAGRVGRGVDDVEACWLDCNPRSLGDLNLAISGDGPVLVCLASAALLAVFGLLVGIRLGTNSSSAYTQELQRLNKVLVEQNRGLEDANSILLKELSSESRTPSKSA